MYCIDSDLLIDFLNGEAHAHVLLGSLDTPWCTTVMNVQEVRTGLRKDSWRERLAMALFERTRIVPYRNTDVTTVMAVKSALKAEGTPIGDWDEIVAGICIANGLTLLTRNAKRFRKVRGLKVKAI